MALERYMPVVETHEDQWGGLYTVAEMVECGDSGWVRHEDHSRVQDRLSLIETTLKDYWEARVGTTGVGAFDAASSNDVPLEMLEALMNNSDEWRKYNKEVNRLWREQYQKAHEFGLAQAKREVESTHICIDELKKMTIGEVYEFIWRTE